MDAPPAPHPPPLRAHLLGPVRLAVGERSIPDRAWPRRAARTLLLVLLATPGHRLPRDRVLDLLWPDTAPAAATNHLGVALHALRRVLEPALPAGHASAYVTTEGDAVALRSPPEPWVDTDAFEATLARAWASPSDHPAVLREALPLYGGHLLADEPNADWAVGRRERLRRDWRRAILDLAEHEVAVGCPLATVPALERLVADDPTDEAANRALMRAYAAAGRRAEALVQYGRCVEALRDALGTGPVVETVALAAEIRSSVPAPGELRPPATPARQFDNLPTPPTPLVGREREIEALHDLLLDPNVPLVTVTGTGGIGKTRLALAAARQVAEEFADGVCFVPLATIRDPSLVVPAVGRALRVQEVADRPMAELLGEVLRERDLLLVLDNLEQVLAAGGDIADLLAACPRLKVLATSREPLRLRAEHLLETPPLAVPPVGRRGASAARAATVGRYEAVALFAQRAQAAHPGFAVTDADAPVMAALCARLDGLPLAIELAAARSRHLAPADLLPRLEHRLSLLTDGPRDLPERLRTIRGAISWSHDLLAPAERALFRRLAVFVGGFSLEAATAVCPAAGDLGLEIAEGTWALADKSLLRRDDGPGGEEPRYGMLETIREFGLEQLAASGEEEATRRAHAAFFLDLAERAVALIHGADQLAWLDRLATEHDNLRAALAWALEREEAEAALALAGPLSEFWRMTGHLTEGRAWLDRALALSGSGRSPARARALTGAGALAQLQGDTERGLTLLTAALEGWRELADRRGEGQTLILLAGLARARGDYPLATDLNEQALALFEAAADTKGIADALNQLGIIASDRGEYDRARELFERGLALYRVLGGRHGPARVLNNLGIMAFWQQEYGRAAELFGASLDLWRALGNRPYEATVLANLGETLRDKGDLERAIAVTESGLALSREVGDKRSVATALFTLGSLMQYRAYDPRAVEPLVEGLLLYQRVGDRLGIGWCLEALAGPAAVGGWPALAAQLLGAAEALREEVGVPLQPAERPAYERHLEATRSLLSEAALCQAWAVGRGLPLDAVVALAADLVSKPAQGMGEPAKSQRGRP